uniref:DNA-directed RNA polymerase subunit n=1 Tax=Jenufa minuta TaxID=993092 RepID=A0A0S2LNP5_JENMI|nr:beta' subunit of RNA polymerase [Jenufa minuta]ALO62980.1 beta' subunit of RNA polymerase [Jenufa minuta]
MGLEKSNSVSFELTSKNKKVNSKIFEDLNKKHLYTPESIYQTIQVVKLQLASSEIIKKWAEKKLANGKLVGQVTNANTLHHKSFKPLKGGLFCERIFGPTKDFQCSCGKKKKPLDLKLAYIKEVSDTSITNALIPRQFCPVCDVEYTWSVIRRYQLGFIELVMPVAHVWYFQNSPSYLSIFLDFKKKVLESILYCSLNLTLENLQSLKTPLVDPELNAYQSLTSVNSMLTPVLNQLPKSRHSISFEKRKVYGTVSTDNYFAPKRLENWRHLNFKKFFSTKWKIQISIKEIPIVSTPTKILLKFQSFHSCQQKKLLGSTPLHRKLTNKSTKSKNKILLRGSLPITETSFKTQKKTLISFSIKNMHFKNYFLLTQKKVDQIFFKIKIELVKNYLNINRDLNNVFPDIRSKVINRDKINTRFSKSMYNGTKESEFEYLSFFSTNRTKPKEKLNAESLIFDKKNNMDVLPPPFYPLLVEQKGGVKRWRKGGQRGVNETIRKLPLSSMSFLYDKKKHLFFFNNSLKTYKNLTLNLDPKQVLFVDDVPLTLVNDPFLKISKNTESLLIDTLEYERINFHITQIDKHSQPIISLLGFRIKKEIFHTYDKLLNLFPLSMLVNRSEGPKTSPRLNQSNIQVPLTIDNDKKVPLTPLSGINGKVVHKWFKKLHSINSILKKLYFPNNSFIKNHSSGPNVSKIHNYSLYCVSHRYCWEKEKHWSNFLYYYNAPSKLGDLPISLYKQRLVDNDKVPLLGAKIIHKLLKDFHYDELKKMDKQNRISLYELTKTYEGGFNKSKLIKHTQQIKKNSSLINVNGTYINSESVISKLKNFNHTIDSVTIFNPTDKNIDNSLMYTIPKNNNKMLSLVNDMEASRRMSKAANSKSKTKKVTKKSSDKNWIQFSQKRNQLLRRIKFIRSLSRKHAHAENMIFYLIPVIPPDLRPILKIQDQVAASDLNKLYQKIIYRNQRLKKFVKDSTMNHSYEMKYAQKLLQAAVDNLFQNGKVGNSPEKDSRGRLLKSLSDLLKGKQGRFRQNLLGKRVDYSGRSVIVVGPQLQIHECGLPKEMALELFLPFLLKRIIHLKMAHTVIGAKAFLKHHPTFTLNLLYEVMQNSPILLNRAPTLHRLGIQAFQPKLIDGRAILLHPLVCSAFNADFDGDQMAVHIPLTVEARAEAWKLMCSANHFFSPATGDPLLLPSQDIVLGCYYLTTEIKKKMPIMRNYCHNTLSHNNVYEKNHHQIIWMKWGGNVESILPPAEPIEMRINVFGNWNTLFDKSLQYFDSNGNIRSQYIRTTIGRLLFHELLTECIHGAS